MRVWVVIAALLLSSCQKPASDSPTTRQVEDYPDAIQIWVDPETGCEYIVGRFAEWALPRWNADGSLRCQEVKKPN